MFSFSDSYRDADLKNQVRFLIWSRKEGKIWLTCSLMSFTTRIVALAFTGRTAAIILVILTRFKGKFVSLCGPGKTERGANSLTDPPPTDSVLTVSHYRA
jgi:hypothetical protein